MLGGEQSGHIEAIGFEMYTQMLEEAVSKLKGEGREERPQVTVNLGISLRIDENYIAEENQRLRMYKRIAGAETDLQLTDVRAELEDRYGKPPESVLHLLAVGEIRLTCERMGVAQVERKRVAVDGFKVAPAAASRSAGSPQTVSRPQPLAGRHGQAPQVASLQFSSRAALHRTESNATRAVRETAAVRPTNAPFARAGQMKPMRDMLFVTFSEKLHAAPAGSGKGINVGALMKLVARNAKNGAQLTPQGVLRWPLSGGDAETVIAETRELLIALEGAPIAV
jgi:transcription-repair coupling factor (superfamily II helicase)